MSARILSDSMELPTRFIKLEDKPPKMTNRMSMTLPRTASITLPPCKDWREGKSLSQRQLYMLEHQIECDVVFEFPSDNPVLRSKKIRAHFFVLKSGSSVLGDMMALSPRKLEPIQIRSVDPTTFWILLTFLYTDDIELTIDNVSPLFNAANKYKVHSLRQRCVDFMGDNVTEETVCVILDEAVRGDHSSLVEKCLHYIDKDTSDVLKSPGFVQLSDDSLGRILSRDQLIVREEELYTAVLEWAKGKCKMKGLLPTGKNCRQVLGKLFFQIRFPLMNPQFYTNRVASSDLLTDAEKIDLFKYFFGSPKPSLSFSEKPRQWNKRASGILFTKPYPDIFAQGSLGSNMF